MQRTIGMVDFRYGMIEIPVAKGVWEIVGVILTTDVNGSEF